WSRRDAEAARTWAHAAGRVSANSIFRSLQVRNFRLYTVGFVASTVGVWMQATALAWLTLRLAHNQGSVVGYMLALRYTPIALFGAWCGVLADRFAKWRLLLVSQGVVAVAATGLAIIDLTGVVKLWMVFVLVAVSGFGLAIDQPARSAFVMEMVDTDDVVNAVALTSASFYGGRLFGPALAGVVIELGGTGI